uniref:protein-glutamine gamma-glutamyltransferase n=1 Tax=Tetranychus evansi TaxID=178897 RepID=A0A3G5API8_9ACAR|nr:annulin-like [Tetranychus evansi]
MGQSCSSCLRSLIDGRRYRFPSSSRPEPIRKMDPYALNVRSVDLLIERNTKKHYTDLYETTKHPFDGNLVVRRGSSFQIRILFARETTIGSDVVNLIFRVADSKRPKYSEGTEITLPVGDENMNEINPLSRPWEVSILSWETKSATLEITPAINTIIGEWKLSIETRSIVSGRNRYSTFQVPASIYILFNPWNKNDLTYLWNDKEREEYVLNDNGIIWKGTHSRLRPSPWSYAQFEDKILECSILILTNLGNLPIADRANPIKVVRHLTRVIHNHNVFDGYGVLVGRWDGKYKGGTDPTKWIGSRPILQNFYLNRKPVKYAQCWVFAGVLTTVCRCLGIPARPVTNYDSAHDTHASLTVDVIVDDELGVIDELTKDSVWNFHVWTEVWLKRPDLSFTGVYDGWQVIDATPQEPSDGIYQCGPTSVNAIRNGEITRDYDGRFVFAEVNADEVYWLRTGSEETYKYLQSDIAKIGKNLSTKQVGANDRIDLTSNYKHQEETPEEREIMLKALHQSNHIFTKYYLNAKFSDIRFDLQLLDDVLIGKPFKVRLIVENKSGLVYTVETLTRLDTVFGDGKRNKEIKRDKSLTKIPPLSEVEIAIPIEYEDYEHHLVDQNTFSVVMIAKVLENDYHYAGIDNFRLRMPDINIEVVGDVFEKKPFTCHAYFKNPLPKRLNKGIFLIEGPGLVKPNQTLKIPLKRSVKADDWARVTFTLTPTTTGEKTIIVKFYSKELKDVDGSRIVRVSRDTTLFNIDELDERFRRT